MVVNFRPKTFGEFHGQTDLVKRLALKVKAAKASGTMPTHTLLSGPPGLGKTTLAEIIANELGVPSVTVMGPSLESTKEVILLLGSLRKSTVVFIDEIHGMDVAAEELFYSAMEDGKLYLTPEKDDKASSLALELPPLTVVGATTKEGSLSRPMRDRFGFQGRLKPYSLEELEQIVQANCTELLVDASSEACREIAARSRKNPRIAGHILNDVIDYVTVEHGTSKKLDLATTEKALAFWGIDNLGLDAASIEYLKALCLTFKGKAVGIQRVAAHIGESASIVESKYEPYLLSEGLIEQTSQGRKATEKAFQHLGLAPNSKEAE